MYVTLMWLFQGPTEVSYLNCNDTYEWTHAVRAIICYHNEEIKVRYQSQHSLYRVTQKTGNF